MTLQMNRSWEDDDLVVGPLAQAFRCCPEQFQAVESFLLERLRGLSPPARRRERLAFLAERCPQLAGEAMKAESCRAALETMARHHRGAPNEDSAADHPLSSIQQTMEAMVACAASLVISSWMSSHDSGSGGLGSGRPGGVFEDLPQRRGVKD